MKTAHFCFWVLLVALYPIGFTHAAEPTDEPALRFPIIAFDQPEITAPGPSNTGASKRSHTPVPVVSRAEKHDTSLPLSWMPVDASPQPKVALEVVNRPIPFKPPKDHVRDTVVQDSPFSPDVSITPEIPSTSQSFEGVPATGWYPPDTNGDVGIDRYVQTVNVSYAIFDKVSGAKLRQDTIGNLFSGIAPCSTNHGDPIVLYDQLANRWLISQFTWSASTGPYYQCVAISQTSDPMGSYHRYQFQWNTAIPSDMNDYPHFGIWPDGYYVAVNEFQNGASFVGGGSAVFERSRMLSGLSAQMVGFHRLGNWGKLPSDLDGSTLPPAGAPNYFVNVTTSPSLVVHKFHVDWTTPSNSTYTLGSTASVASYSPASSVPQPGTGMTLASLSDRLMFRLAYRNLGTHESLVVNHSVSSGGLAGVRWYEIRNPGGTATVFQQGTYAPADGVHRWMGSIAMDNAGNIGVGYSVSNSSSVFPGIRYTGRLSTDPIGTLPQGEGTMISGGGSQTGASRWGDYSSMNIDPVDDCTFWYTQEYYSTSGSTNWKTRISSFKFPGCGGASCTAPSVTTNNSAADADACADTGVNVNWPADPANWNDGGTGTRTYNVLRNGSVIASGLSYGTTSRNDNTGTNGTNYTYSVQYVNGCGSVSATSGASAADNTGSAQTQTANQSTGLTAKNNTKISALAPAFTVGAGQATSATITWSLTGTTDLITCAAIRLRAPDGTESTLKAAGAGNTGNANVLSFYNAEGPGTYTLVLQELSGCGLNNKNAKLNSGQMVVTNPGSCSN